MHFLSSGALDFNLDESMKNLLNIVFFVCFSSILTACASLATPGPDDYKSDLTMADASGEWEGTYYQYNIGRSFPMRVTIQPTQGHEFVASMSWPTISASESKGNGRLRSNSIAWSETELLKGPQDLLTLDGSYKGYLRNDGTLEGRYVLQGGLETRGSLELRRLE